MSIEREVGRVPEQSLIESAQEFRDTIEALNELVELVDDSARRLDDDRACFERRMLLAHPSLEDAGKLYDELRSLLDDAVRRARELPEEQAPSEENSESVDSEITVEVDLSKLAKEYDRDVVYAAMRTFSRERRARATVAFNSLLVAAVAEFEALCYQCIKSFVTKYPAKLSNSNKGFTFEEISNFSDLNYFRAHAIEVYAESIMRGSIDDWLKWFTTNLKLQSSDVTDNWDDFFEIFQRRHLLVHNGGVVNHLYRSKVKKIPGDVAAAIPGLELRADVKRDYLHEALARLHVAGLLVAIHTALRVNPPRPHGRFPADSLIADVSYEFLQENRGREQALFSERALHLCREEGVRLLVQVNLWIQRKRDYGSASIRDEVTRWDVRHCSERFQIAKLALLDLHSETCDMGKRLVAREVITQSEWDSWPLFEDSRVWLQASSASVQESHEAAPGAAEGDGAMGRP